MPRPNDLAALMRLERAAAERALAARRNAATAHTNAPRRAIPRPATLRAERALARLSEKASSFLTRMTWANLGRQPARCHETVPKNRPVQRE